MIADETGAANIKSTDAILLASGYSRRFCAGNKLIWKYNGKPLALYTLELVCSLPFKTVHFVAADPDVMKLAAHFPVLTHHNIAPIRGQCESVRLGVLASDADYYMFFPCDQPLLDAGTVLSICAKAAPGKIAFPAFKGRPSSPTLFSKAFRAELITLKDGENARVIKGRYPDALLPVPVTDENILTDIDSTEDLKALTDPLL